MAAPQGGNGRDRIGGRAGTGQVSEWADHGDDHAEPVVHLARRTDFCRVLGPGTRAVLWVQGCPLRCRGCVAPETLPFAGGDIVTVASLVDDLGAVAGIEGLTLSGGDPFSQAPALVKLIDALRHRRPELSFMSYTGFTVEWLRTHGSAAQRALVDQLDILVDGPYLPERHTNLRWRGSDNQRVHLLTDRYAHEQAALAERGTWLEFDVEPDGSLHWTGIPPVGFRAGFEQGMTDSGIPLAITPSALREDRP